MKRKILVVDNNSIILEFMTDLLTNHGHEVMTADDGLSALDVLATFIPDIIFVDLVMPNIDGKKLCQIIRGMPQLRDAYVAILSAVAIDDEMDLAALGADLYIVKRPLDELAQAVLNALENSEQSTSKSQNKKIILGDLIPPQETTRELLSAKEHLEIILESLSEGIVEVGSGRRIIYANPAAVSLFGIPEEKMLGSKFTELFKGSDHDLMEELTEKMFVWSLSIADEAPLYYNSRFLSLHSIPFYDGERRAIIIINDVTERKQAEEKLKNAKETAEAANVKLEEVNRQLEAANQELHRLTLIDGLTGIANRRHFDDVLDKEWRRCRRAQAPISLIMADIDYFKRYNDRYGHLQGDDCLRKVAQNLQTFAQRPGDLVARYGGEELAIILPDTPSENAFTIAENSRNAVASLNITHEDSPVADTLTISLGVVSMLPQPGMSPPSLIEAADKSLYKAKEEGRNRTIRFYER